MNTVALFQQSDSNLSMAQKNSEVNRFVGWSIFSALKKYADDSKEENECKRLLLWMMLKEDELDDDYWSKCYDSNMSLLNNGGLTLVSKEFFDWGRKVMQLVRSSFTPEDIRKNLRNCFKNGKRKVMDNHSIRSEFVLKCMSKFSRDSIDKVFAVIIRKVVHARFAVVFRQWKEVNCKKHEVSTRAQLKATVPDGKKGKKRHAAALNCEEDMAENTENKKAKVN